jgi:3-dehydrosphinganine reductase
MKKLGGGRIVFVSSQVAQVAIHGYTAYAASKWALRGLAEALQMEVKPHGILVSVCYPPDTDTPGYEAEMLTKPDITKSLSESGDVFTSEQVADDILEFSAKGYYGISTGFDGWLLKQLHPGMSPCNNLWEVWQGILFSGIARFISLFYIADWDSACFAAVEKQRKEEAEKKNQ